MIGKVFKFQFFLDGVKKIMSKLIVSFPNIPKSLLEIALAQEKKKFEEIKKINPLFKNLQISIEED